MRNPIKSNPMPPRWIIVGIVLFWAATFGLLFYREILPQLTSDEPLIFWVEAADEYRTQQGQVPRVGWWVDRNGKQTYQLQTMVLYDKDDDLFEIQGSL